MNDVVVFDIGHGVDTYPPSKGVKGFAEHSFNAKVVQEAKKLAEKNGFKVILSQNPFEKEVSLFKRVKDINNHHKSEKVLCIISFHANASSDPKANGKGVFYSNGSVLGEKLARIWLKESSLLDLSNWGSGLWICKKNTWTDFYIVQKTIPPCILIEHFFFTNASELKRCNTPKFIKNSSEVAVRSLCKFTNKKFIPITHTEPTQTKLYKVQVGAFEDVRNAKALEKQLRSKGFDSYII